MCGAAANAPIGFFGKAKSLTIQFDERIEDARVHLQGMTEKHAEDVTAFVTICNNQLIIPGSLFNGTATVIQLIK